MAARSASHICGPGLCQGDVTSCSPGGPIAKTYAVDLISYIASRGLRPWVEEGEGIVWSPLLLCELSDLRDGRQEYFRPSSWHDSVIVSRNQSLASLLSLDEEGELRHQVRRQGVGDTWCRRPGRCPGSAWCVRAAGPRLRAG